MVAIQRGGLVYVYDENKHQLFAKQGQLQGYTSGSLTVRIGDMLYIYDVNGRQVSGMHC